MYTYDGELKLRYNVGRTSLEQLSEFRFSKKKRKELTSQTSDFTFSNISESIEYIDWNFRIKKKQLKQPGVTFKIMNDFRKRPTNEYPFF